LGQLRESGWQSEPVKSEVRRNAVARIAAGGKDAERLPDALAEAERLIRAAL